jgi:hypothetical protein
MDTFLPSSSLSGLGSLILFPLFTNGVIDTGGKFATYINNKKQKFAAAGNFAADVVDTGGAC